MSFAITLGFDSAKHTSTPVLLYLGEDKDAARTAFMSPPPGILRTELTTNPPADMRRSHESDGIYQTEIAPAVEDRSEEIEELTKKLTDAQNALTVAMAQVEEKDLAAVIAQAEIVRLTALVSKPLDLLDPSDLSDPQPLLPDAVGTAKDAAKRK